MNASGTVVSNGSTVILSCWLNNGGSSSNLQNKPTITILHNSSAVSSSSGFSVSAHISQHTFGRQAFICQRSSRQKTEGVLVCGIYVDVGIPPAQPKNILCIQHGKDGSTICTWDKGHYTYLDTTYTLQLTNGTTNETTVWKEERNQNRSYGAIELRTKLNSESTYTVVINATNGLGKVSSQPIQFTLIDIVKPHAPVNLSVAFEGSDARNCSISWQDQQEAQHFRLRYQPMNSNSWTMLENINSRRYYLHDLKPDTAYEFQVSCRFLPNKGLWSDWSLLFQTEAVPFQPIDVWYLMEDVSSEMQNITLFWKTSILEVRRRSHDYRVMFSALNQMCQRATGTNSTAQTIFSQIIPKTDYSITISSHNSRGTSQPIYITTKLGITDLPPPNHLSTVSLGNGRISVLWEAPIAPFPFINGYVLQWAELHHSSHLRTPITWLKIPISNLTATTENLKPNTCYRISVFALYQSRAGRAASTEEDVSAKAPLTGPQINATVKERSILVSWQEIPDDHQVGCIVHFKLYLQKQFVTVPPKVYGRYLLKIRAWIPLLQGKFWLKRYWETSRDGACLHIPNTATQPFSVRSVEPGAAYVLWMTASTKAGESPKGNKQEVYIKGHYLGWGIKGFGFIVVQLSSLLSVLLCGWHGKAVPDPANSSCAKEFTSVEDERSFYSTEFLKNLNSVEEPETLQIEEVLMKRQQMPFLDVSLFKPTEEGGESHNWPTAVSFQEEDPIVKNLDYDPLITSRTGGASQHQLLPLYRKVGPEEPNQGQEFSVYLASPRGNVTVDYLPTISPAIMDTGEDNGESELNPLFIFQRTSFLPQTFPFGGKLTLDAIQMDCDSFTE
ncbi:interleukin-12 receptor subunit beta-2 [Lacerta agilis]|uniref:interleukin-12 receptor subunit beta-2 n=1 Tax=Lacerta agilis TaxID=80427 RepID=UPI00141A4000|nr:interleukin-12 receptor subunit beta-2 [Lacerta agilis]